MEDKCKVDYANKNSTKKIMRLEMRRQQTILPHEEMIKIMLSASKEETSTYSLFLDIEKTTNLRKVLKEHVLNEKVTFTLEIMNSITLFLYHQRTNDG